jgi:hypothetical protein
MPLVGRVRVLVVADLISQVDMVRHPVLVLQVAILSLLPGEGLQQRTNSKISRPRSRKPELGQKRKKLTGGGSSFRL